MTCDYDDISSIDDYDVDLTPYCKMWNVKYRPINDTVTLDNSEISTDTSVGVDGKNFINEKEFSDRLSEIEKRLNILRPNHKLESEWEQLSELRQQYEQLEKQLIEKQRMWNSLRHPK